MRAKGLYELLTQLRVRGVELIEAVGDEVEGELWVLAGRRAPEQVKALQGRAREVRAYLAAERN